MTYTSELTLVDVLTESGLCTMGKEWKHNRKIGWGRGRQPSLVKEEWESERGGCGGRSCNTKSLKSQNERAGGVREARRSSPG